MSSFGWLDFSEHERRKALDVVSLFAEKETVDEMGLGVVRDGIAEILSPGTSTIQTRAKYFLFVPWIYMNLEARGTAAAELEQRARRAEVRLIDELMEGDDTDGVIGKQARGGLKRMPSAIYWNGLARWGIRLTPLSQDALTRSFDRVRAAHEAHEAREARDQELAPGRPARTWHPAIPPPPKGFPSGATLALTRGEAEYLRDRIMSRGPGTLLAFLVDRGRPAEPVQSPWMHPQFGEFPAKIHADLEHARNFSEAMHGSALLYNLMLAELAKNDDWIADYEERLADWVRSIETRMPALRAWDRTAFFHLVALGGARVSVATRTFVETWLGLALDAPASTPTSKTARRLVEGRELALKGPLARLQNAKARDSWGGASGDLPADYRWVITQRVVADIQAGLARGGDDARPA